MVATSSRVVGLSLYGRKQLARSRVRVEVQLIRTLPEGNKVNGEAAARVHCIPTLERVASQSNPNKRKRAASSADGETDTSMASAADSPDLISGGKRRRRQRPAMVATAIVFAAAIALVVSCSVLATTSRHQRAMTLWRWKRRLQLKARMLLRRASTLKDTSHRPTPTPRSATVV